MDGDGVSVRVGKHESPPEWTIERRGNNSNACVNKPIVQGLGVVGFEPEPDAPTEMLDSLQINGGLTNGKRNRSGGKDDRSWWALGCPLKAKLLRIESSRRLDVADLQ